MWWNALQLALRAIRRNLLRSFLTVLGIVIGVASVITMVNLGSGATAQVSAQIASLGSNLLMVRSGQRVGPGVRSAAPPFKLEDAETIRREIGGLNAVAPTSAQAVTAIFGNTNWSTTVTGVDNNYFKARDWHLADGRLFSLGELRTGKAICIIGSSVRRELFGAQDPIGAKIRLKNVACEVAGLLASKGQSSMGSDQDDLILVPLRMFWRRIAGDQNLGRRELFGAQDPIGAKIRLKNVACEVAGLLASKGQSSMGSDQDDLILVPLRMFWRRIAGDQNLGMIQLSAREGVSTAKVQREVEQLLRERRHIAPGEDDDFSVMDMKQIADTLTGTTKVLTGLLGAVAAVSLLVGGIGIMNIMLVSVTERTREIGIRLAIGALEHEVLLQFLVEAAVLSSFGGLFGILLALAATSLLAGLIQVPLIIDPAIILIAFFFSAAIGVIFGYFPARRAARLDPIEALRHE